MEQLLDLKPLDGRHQDTSVKTAPIGLLKPLRPPQTTKILDFDLETVAAGFADPQWVPQKITCCAWSWIGSDKVESRVCTPEGLFGKPELRRWMLIDLLSAIQKADMLTGHNLIRFDLPVLNAECMRLHLPTLQPKMVQDTIRVQKSKGFKKGQDNMARLLKVPAEKMPLDWQQWQNAYDEDGWTTIRQRCESDIVQHKLMREQAIAEGWIKAPTVWRP